MIVPEGSQEYCKKMSSASMELLIRLPFFGCLLNGAAVKVRPSKIATMATTGKDILCGEAFVESSPQQIVVFGLLHECLHIYMGHVSRRDDRDPQTWNIAIDIWTNMMCSQLLADGGADWEIPDMFVQPKPWAKDLTVEAIYERIKRSGEPLSSFTAPKNAGEVSNGTDVVDVDPEQGLVPDQTKDPAWQEEFRYDVSRALAVSDQMKQALPGELVSRMQKLMKPQAPWSTMLRGGLCQDLGWDNMSYTPPKMNRYPLILPRLTATKERILVLGVDVSGSISDAMIKRFITEAMAAAENATSTIVVVFDAVAREVYETRFPRDIMRNVKFLSGPHSYTSAMDVFDVAQKRGASAVAVLTDGYLKVPEKAFPNTHWVLPENGKTQDWGRQYRIGGTWI